MSNNPDNENEYVDCLAHKLGSLSFGLKKHEPEAYRYASDISVLDLKTAVFKSESVRKVILEKSTVTNQPLNVIEDEAKETLNRIAADFAYSHFRVLAFSLDKVLRQIFNHVYVNKSGIKEYCASFKDSPVVLLPTHSSYFDFILASYICYALNLPLPVIASGEDFLNIFIATRLMRGAGAFFLKRSFSEDPFYATIFKVYTQHLLKASQNPLEFYPEGTRSRAGLALHPKFGMLSMVSQLFLRGRIPDVKLIPIGISFECIAEEMLYVNEVLGIPKPKESFGGMLKAAKRSLEWDCGDVHFHFGDPISLSSFCNGRIDRNQYCLYPRDYDFSKDNKLIKEEAKVIWFLGHQIISCQQKLVHIFPRYIVSSLILHRGSNMELGQLAKMLDKINAFIKQYCPQRLSHDQESNSKNAVVESLRFCSYLELSSDSTSVEVCPVKISKDEAMKFKMGRTFQNPSILDDIVTYHALAAQRNRLIGTFMFASMFAVCLFTKSSGKDQPQKLGLIRKRFRLLHSTLRLLFVYEPDSTADVVGQDISTLPELATIVDVFTQANIIHVDNNKENPNESTIEIYDNNKDLLEFIASLILPFIQAIWVVNRWFIVTDYNKIMDISLPEISHIIQEDLALFTNEGGYLPYEAMSLQTIKLILTSLKSNGLIRLEKSMKTNKKVIHGVLTNKINDFLLQLGELINTSLISLLLTTANSSITSKL